MERSGLFGFLRLRVASALAGNLTSPLSQLGDLSRLQLQTVLSLLGGEVRVGPILIGSLVILLELLVALLLLLLSNLSVLSSGSSTLAGAQLLRLVNWCAPCLIPFARQRD